MDEVFASLEHACKVEKHLVWLLDFIEGCEVAYCLQIYRDREECGSLIILLALDEFQHGINLCSIDIVNTVKTRA